MPRYIAEFILDSDIRLPDHSEPLRWHEETGKFELTIENYKPGFSLIEDALRATLIFVDADLKSARETCQNLLASILNALVWTSCSMIRQSRLVKVVDWDHGKTMRDALFFQESPRIAISEPFLTSEILESAGHLFQSQHKDRMQSALRWFRLGVGGNGIEEQFTYFWFSLETAAEYLKSPERVRSSCTKCNGDLYCNQCSEYPTHRKFSADAIKDLVYASIQDKIDAENTFRALIKVRHTLMHGRRIESIEPSLPFNAEVATNKLAKISRDAIFRMGDYTNYRRKSLDLTLVETDSFIRGKLIASMHIQTTFGADPDNPTLSGADGIKVSMSYGGEAEVE